MASQPPCTPSSPKYPDEGGKTAPQECSAQPPLVRDTDDVHHPGKLPWAALVAAFGLFRQPKLEMQQDQMLAPLKPLAMEEELSEKLPIPNKKFWGDHEALSKIPFQILSGHRHIVSSCLFCVNDTKLLSGSYDCTVKLWDAVDGSIVRDFEHGPRAPVLECSVTADSRRIVAAAYDKTVRTWDLETGKLLWKISLESIISSCKFSPDGKYVASGLDVDHGICITDAKDATTVSLIRDHHKKPVTACCFDPDSQKVASVSLDKSVKIWDVTSQATVLTITQAHSNAISNCCFTFSGHFLCTSSWDKTLKIWNVHTGEFRNRGACVTLMQGHEGCVSSCRFARDTSFLASGGFDKTVAIWDVGEGYRKLSLKGHDDWVMDVAVSNNKKWVLSASKVKVANPGVRLKTFIIKDPTSQLRKSHSFLGVLCACYAGHLTGHLAAAAESGNVTLLNVLDFIAAIINHHRLYHSNNDKTMRLWNIEEIDNIPLVIDYKKALGLKVKQCEECERPFSNYESDIFSEIVTKCVFCRMDAQHLSAETSSSPENDSSASGYSLGKDD